MNNSQVIASWILFHSTPISWCVSDHGFLNQRAFHERSIMKRVWNIHETKALVLLHRFIPCSMRSLSMRFFSKGTVKQTPHIEGVFNEIRACQIPKCWLAKSYLTAKPLGSYIFNLNERIKWFRKWKDHGQPDVLWISSFFNVRAVISATLQVSSRKQRIPLTEITFDIRILDVRYVYFLLLLNSLLQNRMFLCSETILQEDGIRIMGVYIQNARWNSETHKLSDQRPKIGLDTMPDIYVYVRKH